MSLRRGIVLHYGIRVGVLEEVDGGGTRFTYYEGEYIEEWISPTMPLRREPYEVAEGILPFFDNMIPEGRFERAATIAAQLEDGDRFGLLLYPPYPMVVGMQAYPGGAIVVVPERWER